MVWRRWWDEETDAKFEERAQVALNPKPKTLNPKPKTRNPKPETLHPKL